MTDPSRTLVVQKTIAATQERLFAAWTEPDELRQWWGQGRRHLHRPPGRSPSRRLLPHREPATRRLDSVDRREFEAVERPHRLRTLIGELQAALTEVRTLRGLLPICANCKRIRSDSGGWEQVESYVRAHTHAEFRHAICPDCLTKLYG
jgi:activator of Hsp90 ATPase-like protein